MLLYKLLRYIWNSYKKGNIWNIYFTNLSSPTVVGTGSGTIGNIQSTNFSFGVSLYKPNDSVIYTFDVKNGGTLNAELSSINLIGLEIAKNNNISYTVRYDDGSEIKIGDVAYYIDFETGKVVRNVVKKVLNGSEIYINRTSQGTFSNCSWLQTNISDLFENTIGKSTHFTTINNNINDVEHLRYITSTDMLGIIIDKSRLITDDVAGFKAWLAANNVNVYYKIATPTETNISIPSLPSLTGNITYTIGTSVQPRNIDYNTEV